MFSEFLYNTFIRFKMNFATIKKRDFLTTNWSGGKTEQIFIYPEVASYAIRNFLVRISTATVEVDRSEFTILPNIKRIIMPLSSPITLFEKKEDNIEKKIVSLKPFETYSFLGNVPIVSYGKCRDFNIMTSEEVESSLFVLKAGETINLKKSTFLFVFSYNVSGSFFVLNKRVEINSFDFVLLSKIDKNISITNNANKNLLLGSLIL